MDAMLFAFVAAALAGMGDRSQLVAATLSTRSGRPGLVLAGFVLAAIALATIAWFAGVAIQEMVGARGRTLLVALALAFAGVVGLMKPSGVERAVRFRGGAFLAALIFGFSAASGGRVQFLNLAFASLAESPAVAAAAGAAGFLAACTPAALLGETFLKLELRWVRIAIAIAFLLAAVLVYLAAPPA
jgi:putative Ca2+/H+ antiporter (TMEM165/GDT1 family)